ncbi:MAG: hypothetical protein QOI94_751, partial [Acidobacteriaceae bacterium]|nr:hypothetical protein [Acidobacteriaceae bacterium]
FASPTISPAITKCFALFWLLSQKYCSNGPSGRIKFPINDVGKEITHCPFGLKSGLATKQRPPCCAAIRQALLQRNYSQAASEYLEDSGEEPSRCWLHGPLT